MTKIAPSILAADPLQMFDAVKLVKDTGCDELHFDVMDGHFVPNISFGPSLLAAIHKEFDLHCDVHLMISDPLKYVENFAKSGAGTITTRGGIFLSDRKYAPAATAHAPKKPGRLYTGSTAAHTRNAPAAMYSGSAERIFFSTIFPAIERPPCHSALCA